MLTNATVHTADPACPFADTVVIDGRVLTFVGARADWTGDDLDVRDLGGRVIVPGFVDAHTHPAMVSRSRWHVALPRTDDLDELLAFIAAYAADHPRDEAPFLYFEYYSRAIFGDAAPDRHLLDAVVADRPVLCQDFSEHEHWVNTRMLELMGVTRHTPDPVPGLEMFVRDPDGEPTGLLREMVHLHFVDALYARLGWRPPEQATPELLAPFFRFMSENGVTALFEALTDEDVARSVAELDDQGRLPLVYEGAVRFRHRRDLDAAIAEAKRYDAAYGRARVRFRTLKLFLDGTNESGNGAVLAPLTGVEQSRALGQLAMEVDELAECLTVCNAAGIDLHIHLVGDGAFRVACDAVEAARTRCVETDAAWTMQVCLAHCELVDPADMVRPAALGIIVNWTPHWSGGYFGDGARAHLGDERWDRMYRFREIADAGAAVTFGSDVVTEYELHRAAPLLGMQIAATRVDPEYPLDPDRYPGSVRPDASATLPRDLLVKGYTIDAARQLRRDGELGSLRAGKAANLCVLDTDPYLVDADRLGAIGIDAVVFEGDVVAGSL